VGDEIERREAVPTIQAFYDDIFLIFLLSVVIMVVSYTLWGLMEIPVRRGG